MTATRSSRTAWAASRSASRSTSWSIIRFAAPASCAVSSFAPVLARGSRLPSPTAISPSRRLSMSPRTRLASIQAQNTVSAAANPRRSAIVNAS